MSGWEPQQMGLLHRAAGRPMFYSILESTVDSPAGPVTGLTSTQCYHPRPRPPPPVPDSGTSCAAMQCSEPRVELPAPNIARPAMLRLVLHWLPPALAMLYGRDGQGWLFHRQVFTPVLDGPALAVRHQLMRR